MSDRCIVRIKFTPAGSANEMRRAVGGFLRYVQHRDLHPDSKTPRPTPEVSGLLKYVAYRDRASARAELFGPQGPLGSRERKEFAEFVTRSIAGSKPQPFRAKDGRLQDRRRAVSRLILSPERAEGLDLRALTQAAVGSLEKEMGVSRLRWIAAVHRNTAHHHVHLVLAGMHEDGEGGYRRVDVSKARLAAMKEAVALEIERQRGERTPSKSVGAPTASGARGRNSSQPALKLLVERPALIRTLPLTPVAQSSLATGGEGREPRRPAQAGGSIFALRAVARRYQRRMQRELEIDARRWGREWVA
jgi:hypothetical protein